VLKYQKKSGGWMKNIEFHKADDTGAANEHSCLDNGATTMEMRFLAKVYQKTLVEKYKESFQKALNMLFTAEKGCGGWSQYWPLSGNGSYQDYITFNDDLMTNVMKILRDIANNKGDFANITDDTNRAKCQTSYDKAVEVIIKCQVDDNGTPAAWCAQHDTITFLPMEGRPHELPSISGYESASLLSYLMTIEQPSEALQNTIHTAIAWLDAHKYKEDAAVEDFTNASGEADRRIVEKAGSAVWGRFIQLGGETGQQNYDVFFKKLKNRGKSRSYTQDGKTYTYTEYELATKSYNPEKAYQPIFAIYDDKLQHLYYRYMYHYEDTPDSVDWKGCTVPTSLNALRRTKYQFMGSWPLKVIKNEYPKWKQRMENQQGTEGFTPQEVKHGLSDNARLYCLQGVQVTSPRKGIYIQNGKKYVVQ
jgi:pectinesterase